MQIFGKGHGIPIVALPIRKAVMVDTEFVKITVINITYSLDVIFSCNIRQRKRRYRAQDEALLAPMDNSKRKEQDNFERV